MSWELFSKKLDGKYPGSKPEMIQGGLWNDSELENALKALEIQDKLSQIQILSRIKSKLFSTDKSSILIYGK